MNASPLPEENKSASNAPKEPSPHPSAWRKYFMREYSCPISDETLRIIAAAVGAASKQREDLNNLITVNTQELLIPLTAKYAPLDTLELRNHVGAYPGRPPWYEPQPEQDRMSNEGLEAFGSTRPSKEFSSILQTAASLTEITPGFPEVTPWHLAFALISSGATGFKWKLKAHKSSLKAAETVLRSNMRRREHRLESLFDSSLLAQKPGSGPVLLNGPNRSAGTKSDFSRDSTPEEIDDETRRLARAIASTFKSAGDKEFCFALFGPWGRGKTTLIRQVSKELENDFVSVTFNAWKYPSRPEVWVWLYETIKQQAYSHSFWNGLKLGIQCKLRRDNGLPLILPALLLLFSAFSKWTLFSKVVPIPGGLLESHVGSIFTGQFWAMILDMVLAVFSLTIISLYGKKLWSGFGTSLANYVQLPNHGRHLGLQAAIGDDLKRLISTWTATNPNSRESDKTVETLPEFWFTHALNLAWSHWGYLVGFILLELSLGVLLQRIWNQAPPVLFWSVFGLLVLTPAIFFYLLSPVKRAKKVLLVVDDLDRCPPDEMLTVIESLRVFLEDPMIEANLKISMLLDRDILSHAICSKFEMLIQKGGTHNERRYPLRDATACFTRDGIVAEQIEKYFILSFDLPPLASASARTIASKIVGYTEPSEDSRASPQSTPQSTDQPVHGPGLAEDLTSSDNPTEGNPAGSTTLELSGKMGHPPAATTTSPPVEEVHLTSGEKKAMVELLHSLLTTDPVHATPRRMRMIKMRYFLARQILREQEISFNPDDLLKHFSGISIDRRLDPKLAEVVGMVTGRIPEQ